MKRRKINRKGIERRSPNKTKGSTPKLDSSAPENVRRKICPLKREIDKEMARRRDTDRNNFNRKQKESIQNKKTK